MLWRSVLLVDETGVPGENHRIRKKAFFQTEDDRLLVSDYTYH